MSIHYDIDIEFIDILENGKNRPSSAANFLKEVDGNIEVLTGGEHDSVDDDDEGNSKLKVHRRPAPPPPRKRIITPKVSKC
jgi:hypothetical protein